jgi:uncharacterized protein YbaR (Trm112 family)/SAM-dependent methyltransferase
MSIQSALAERIEPVVSPTPAVPSRVFDDAASALTQPSMYTHLRCPVCRNGLVASESTLVCVATACGATFPIVDGIPVLINEGASLFTISDVVASRDPGGIPPSPSWKQRLAAALPPLGKNYRAPENFVLLHDELRARPGAMKRVLVIGGGILGLGMEHLVGDPTVELVETDVFFGPRSRYIVDAHDLPFADGIFDAVVMQGVLGALIDPNRAVSEIQRVLQPNGLVYIETPFVQQVCMGRFDFQRYSHLGLRRLFRAFEEIRSGAQAGPAMALAWSYQYLLWSFVTSRMGRSVMLVVARLTGWWLPQVDRFLLDRPGGIDGASGVFFLGRKSKTVLSDRELLAGYRGAFA